MNSVFCERRNFDGWWILDITSLMGFVTDLLKEIPLSSVLKEKIAVIEAKYAASDTENAILKDDLRKLKAEITKLRKQVEELTHKDDLDDVERELIKLVASELETGGKPA